MSKVIPEFVRVPIDTIRDEMVTYAVRYGAKNFIETGTHYGDTCLHMAGTKYFENIFSVELSKTCCDFLEKNFLQFSKNIGIDASNVRLWDGDSAETLPKMISLVDSRCVFWLDAHVSGGVTVHAEEHEIPIMKEISAISSHPVKDHVIIIDDIRGSFESMDSWPDINEVIEAIKSINSDYLITIKYGILFAEVPGSIPKPLYKQITKPITVLEHKK